MTPLMHVIYVIAEKNNTFEGKRYVSSEETKTKKKRMIAAITL
jgi:hypothetical protein